MEQRAGTARKIFKTEREWIRASQRANRSVD
jgi:hypothetical protein